jgi:hypothetical protein
VEVPDNRSGQTIDVPVRFENLDEEQTISTYLDDTIRTDGLDNPIEEPDDF